MSFLFLFFLFFVPFGFFLFFLVLSFFFSKFSGLLAPAPVIFFYLVYFVFFFYFFGYSFIFLFLVFVGSLALGSFFLFNSVNRLPLSDSRFYKEFFGMVFFFLGSIIFFLLFSVFYFWGFFAPFFCFLVVLGIIFFSFVSLEKLRKVRGLFIGGGLGFKSPFNFIFNFAILVLSGVFSFFFSCLKSTFGFNWILNFFKSLFKKQAWSWFFSTVLGLVSPYLSLLSLVSISFFDFFLSFWVLVRPFFKSVFFWPYSFLLKFFGFLRSVVLSLFKLLFPSSVYWGVGGLGAGGDARRSTYSGASRGSVTEDSFNLRRGSLPPVEDSPHPFRGPRSVPSVLVTQSTQDRLPPALGGEGSGQRVPSLVKPAGVLGTSADNLRSSDPEGGLVNPAAAKISIRTSWARRLWNWFHAWFGGGGPGSS